MLEFNQVYRADHPRSRPCQAIFDALVGAGIPAPVLYAANGGSAA